jgi:hypothetical protein
MSPISNSPCSPTFYERVTVLDLSKVSPAHVSQIQLWISTVYPGLMSFFSQIMTSMFHKKFSAWWTSDISRDHFDPNVESALRRDIPIGTTPQVKTHLISKDQESFTSVSALRPFEHIDIHIEDTDGPNQPRLRVTGMPGKRVASKRVLSSLTHAVRRVPYTTRSDLTT